jgi:hypothetical protein
VFHDDQQGTATVLLSGLINALKVTNRRFDNIRVALVGMGAANVATLRLLLARGVKMEQIIATDSKGILHRDRADVAAQQGDYPDKWRLCQESNVDDVRGGIAEAMRGADVCIAFARPGPDLIKPEWVTAMARDSIGSRARTRCRRCGPGTPRRPARASWARAARISPTSSTIRWASRPSSAGRWTCGRAPSRTRCACGSGRDRDLWRGAGPG